jgi:hypothetical protein
LCFGNSASREAKISRNRFNDACMCSYFSQWRYENGQLVLKNRINATELPNNKTIDCLAMALM